METVPRTSRLKIRTAWALLISHNLLLGIVAFRPWALSRPAYLGIRDPYQVGSVWVLLVFIGVVAIFGDEAINHRRPGARLGLTCALLSFVMYFVSLVVSLA